MVVDRNDNRLKISTTSIKKASFAILRLLIALADVCIAVFLIIGSVAAIILLYKMFPDTALVFLKPMAIIFSLILKIFWVLIMSLYILVIMWTVLLVKKFFYNQEKIFKKKRERERKKFMNEVVSKLKKEFKNK